MSKDTPPKASDEDVIVEVRQMLGMGASLEQIGEHVREEHPHVTKPKLVKLAATAREQMLDDARGSLEWSLACSLQRHRDLLSNARHIQDWSACLKIEAAMLKLQTQLAALTDGGMPT